MKEYPRRYKRLHTDVKRNNLHFKKERVDIAGGKSLTQYIDFTHKFMWEMELSIFDWLVKFFWNRAMFIYNGSSMDFDSLVKNKGFEFNLAMSVLYKRDIGFSPSVITSRDAGWLRKIPTYFKDFFPKFFEENPFEKKYEYPYKYMNLECLVLVHRMEDRLELLRIGEEQKMSYAEFLDYILNHIHCYNEDVGYRKYTIFYERKSIPHVSFFKKKGKRKIEKQYE